MLRLRKFVTKTCSDYAPKLLYLTSLLLKKILSLLPIISVITASSSVNLSCVFIRLKLSMGRYWNVRVLESWFSLINSSHLHSTQPNYRSAPNYPTKTKARVPLSLFVALRLFSCADSRSGVHITRFSQKSKMCWISTIWRKMCWISFSQKN